MGIVKLSGQAHDIVSGIASSKEPIGALGLSSLKILSPSNPCTIRCSKFPIHLQFDSKVLDPKDIRLALFRPGELDFDHLRMLINGEQIEEKFLLLDLQQVIVRDGHLNAEIDFGALLDSSRELNAKSSLNRGLNSILNFGVIYGEEYSCVCYSPSLSRKVVDGLSLTDELCISNSIRLAIDPVEDWKQAIGGFLSPTNGFHGSDKLAVLGWGLRPNGVLDRIELKLNGRQVTGVQSELSSPRLASSLPGLKEAENCMFAVVLDRSQFVGDSKSKVVDLSATLYFSDSNEGIEGEDSKAEHSLNLSTPNFCWSRASEAPLSAIDSIALSYSGGIDLRGWIYTPGFEKPKIFAFVYGQPMDLSSAVESFKDSSSVTSVYKNLEYVCRDDFGFEYRFPPGALGNRPGLVSLYYEYRGQTFPLGNLQQWFKLGHLAFSQSSDQSFTSRAIQFSRSVAGSFRSLSKIGFTGQKSRAGYIDQDVDKGNESASPVFCSQSLSPYEGSPRVLLEMLKVHREKFPSQRPLLISSLDGKLRDDIEKLGFEVLVVEKLALAFDSWDQYLEGLAEVHDHLKDRSLSYFVANTIDCFWGIHLAGILEIPSSWVIHESTSPCLAHTQLDFRQRSQFFAAFSKASRFVFVSESSREVFRDLVGSNSSSVIGNGIDIEKIPTQNRESIAECSRNKLGLVEDDFVLLMVGSLCERKGQHTLLEAFSKLSDEFSESDMASIKLVFVGDREPSYFSKLESLVDENGLRESVIFAEKTRDISAFYAMADVLVIASSEESAPLVSLEAMAWSLPIVSTPVFGLAEQLEDETSALFFPVGDAARLAEQLRRLVFNSTLRSPLGTAARRRVKENFSLEYTHDQYRAEFESLERLKI